jgi:hypothetical protein
MDIFPNCAYFYDQAVYELVERKVFYHGDPLAIGHHIAIRMVHFRDLFYAKKQLPQVNFLNWVYTGFHHTNHFHIYKIYQVRMSGLSVP